MAHPPLRVGAAVALLMLFVALAISCGGGREPVTWGLPNGDLGGTRAALGATLDSRNVAGLRVRWSQPLRGAQRYSGIFASTPVGDAATVYVQDLHSDVFAFGRATGELRWVHRYDAGNDGPNGLAVVGGRVYGATDADAFALSSSTGRELWRRHLTGPLEQFIDVAPVVWNDLLYVGTVGYPPGGRGAIYALATATGVVRWKFDTIEKPWRYPLEAGGGGIWYPVSVDHGLVYAGTANPAPWGGTPRRPNGGAFPGPVRHTDSLVVLDGRTGRLVWFDQVTRHDVRDYDFEATPIIADVGGTDVVIGAGKAGQVVAWDRSTRRRLWAAAVGLHRNDLGALPRRRVVVCPGLLGGVETPMAYAEGRLFVPVVDLCGSGSAVSRQDVTTVDPSRGRGRFVALDAASGRILWQRRLTSPVLGCATVANDVVFTSALDGRLYAFATEDGQLLWHTRMRAGINACPTILGDLVVVGAGLGGRGATPELVAFGPS